MIQKIHSLEEKVSVFKDDYPNYCIEAKLYCGFQLPNDDDFYCEVCTEHSWKNHPLKPEDFQLHKSCYIPIKALHDEKLSYPFYCLLDEHRMSLPEMLNLTDENFYIEINIELT